MAPNPSLWSRWPGYDGKIASGPRKGEPSDNADVVGTRRKLKPHEADIHKRAHDEEYDVHPGSGSEKNKRVLLFTLDGKQQLLYMNGTRRSAKGEQTGCANWPVDALVLTASEQKRLNEGSGATSSAPLPSPATTSCERTFASGPAL